MRIYVSHAPEDKPYCIRIVEALAPHDVWYDQRLNAGRGGWPENLRRLDWCEVFITLLSAEAMASNHCRRELEIARRLKRPIIPVLIDPSAMSADKLRGGQIIDLSNDLTAENVSRLRNAIQTLEHGAAGTSVSSGAGGAGGGIPARSAGPAGQIADAVEALENGNFARAAGLLQRVVAGGYRSRFLRLEELLRQAEAVAAASAPAGDIDRAYQHLVALFKFQNMRAMACEELADFRRKFGDYDPQNLRRYCDADAPNLKAPPKIAAEAPQRAASQSVAVSPTATGLAMQPAQSPVTSRPDGRAQNDSPARQPAAPLAAARAAARADDLPLSANEALPMLQWCDIPHGTVTIASVVGADEDFGEMIEHVDNFVMSKYPVTNAQFAIFSRAPDGYRNPRWWAFSEYAQRWFNQGKGTAEAGFSGDEQPRENVNWYEAMAFANWLGAQLKMKVSLPTIGQWQRAAKGDDDRYYPWGDDYQEEHCNTVETGLKTTTPVNRYHKGASPYGVYDMAGNVWEWTLKTATAAEAGRDYRRAVVGGSYVSSGDRAQTSYRHYLDPRVRYSSIGIRLVGLTQ